MIHPRFLKNLPAPIRTLVRPMLFISLGVHGLLLIMPIPSQEQVELPAEQKPVKITQIPPVPSPVPSPSPTVRLPPPSPRLQQNTPPPVKPSRRFQQRTPLVIDPSPIDQEPEPSPVEEQGTPAPAPPSSIASSPPTPPPNPTPSETFTPPPTPPEEPTPPPTPDSPFADFPHFEGAESVDCSNSSNCRRVAGTQWRRVAKDMLINLRQEYEVRDLNLEDDHIGGYEVLKNSKQQYYLYLVPKGEDTVYVLTEEKLTLEQLREMAQS